MNDETTVAAGNIPEDAVVVATLDRFDLVAEHKKFGHSRNQSD